MDKFVWKTIGHEPITNFLEKSITNQKLSHAYLFYGPKGVGKHHLSLRLAQILQCENNKQKPCGHCAHCRQIKKSIHPDIYKITKQEDKKNISIEQIRELQKKLGLSSFTDSYKIAIIENAQEFSPPAWDSILKTLEEPAPKTIIILITNQIKQIPDTIISRSQVIRFNTIPTQKITEYLTKKLKIEQRQAKVLSHISSGRIGQTLSFIENPKSFMEYKNKANNFINLLESDFTQRLKIIENAIPKKISFLENVKTCKNLLQTWELIIRDIVLLKYEQESLANLFIKPELEKINNSFTLFQLKNILQKIEETKSYLSANVSPKLAMENLLINI